jgi:hypothetical protein
MTWGSNPGVLRLEQGLGQERQVLITLGERAGSPVQEQEVGLGDSTRNAREGVEGLGVGQGGVEGGQFPEGGQQGGGANDVGHTTVANPHGQDEQSVEEEQVGKIRRPKPGKARGG